MQKSAVLTMQAPKPIGPYSQAIAAGNMLFVSGQIALDALSGESRTADIKAETRQVMENLRQILKAAGMGFQDVVKCSIFLKNMDNFPFVNEVYGTYFDDLPPARETVEVSRLPKDVNVEISCIAMK